MKILVVEDELKLGNSLSKGLTAEGYVIDLVQDSDTADNLVTKDGYDLVILDWMIPGKFDGPELVGEWRKKDIRTPVLILTAKSTIGDKVQGLDSGADDYLPKPFSFDELLARIRALLRRPQSNVGTELTMGPISLDSVAKTVSKGGKEIHITAKEFQLLEYLLIHRGEVLSKEQLLDHVWDDDSRVQHNTVETFIANLRKKIGKGESIIKTVRGYGYKIS
jgi:DNA-binding response OmpR family regulator